MTLSSSKQHATLARKQSRPLWCRTERWRTPFAPTAIRLWLCHSKSAVQGQIWIVVFFSSYFTLNSRNVTASLFSFYCCTLLNSWISQLGINKMRVQLYSNMSVLVVFSHKQTRKTLNHQSCAQHSSLLSSLCVGACVGVFQPFCLFVFPYTCARNLFTSK